MATINELNVRITELEGQLEELETALKNCVPKKLLVQVVGVRDKEILILKGKIGELEALVISLQK